MDGALVGAGSPLEKHYVGVWEAFGTYLGIEVKPGGFAVTYFISCLCITLSGFVLPSSRYSSWQWICFIFAKTNMKHKIPGMKKILKFCYSIILYPKWLWRRKCEFICSLSKCQPLIDLWAPAAFRGNQFGTIISGATNRVTLATANKERVALHPS